MTYISRVMEIIDSRPTYNGSGGPAQWEDFINDDGSNEGTAHTL